MAAAASMSVEGQLAQLESARKLVLGDANYYPQIIQGILPIIGPESRVELRRWGAEFLAESFAAPALPAQQKETLSLTVLDSLNKMIENPNEDTSVIKNAIMTAASVYPHVFKWIINNPYDTLSWETMTAIKSRILRIWGTASVSVQICCVKFAQRVVLVQTAGPDGDYKRHDIFGTSLTLVPQNHSLISSRNLEAEAHGLLDRMLSVLQENATDAILVDATLNCLGILIRARPVISNKILNAILSFNPLKLANSPMTPKTRVMVKSMERTTRLLLIHVSKRDPQHPLMPRIHQYLDRLIQSQSKIFDEALRKRGPPEPVDGMDAAKRQRLGAGAVPAPESRLHVPPLSPGPHSINDLFTITADVGLKSFDVSQLSLDLITKMNVLILAKLDAGRLNQAVTGIQQRLAAFAQAPAAPVLPSPATSPLDIDDDDDDYEPDFQAAEDTEQMLNKLDSAPPPDQSLLLGGVGLGPFRLPQPPPLTPKDAIEAGQGTVARVFSMIQGIEETPAKKSKAGLNRMAASNYDRDAWITVLSRLATRATAGLEEFDPVKVEETTGKDSVADSIRNLIYSYILEDFRRRIDVAVSWLSEEWYNDQLQQKAGTEATTMNYEKWMLKTLDGFLPYVDGRDKVLTRFLSEIPGLSPQALDRVKRLCRDPSTVNLVVTSLVYLVMMRPPAREMALDAVEDIWRTYDEAKSLAGKYLKKWRPAVLEEAEEKKPIEEAAPSGTNASTQNDVTVAS